MKSNKDGHYTHSFKGSLPCEYDCIHCHSVVPYRNDIGKLILACLDCEFTRLINIKV